MQLGEARWPEVDPAAQLLSVPLGSCEQHGPHLPLDTDTRIAVALASALAERRDDVVVAPAVAYGSSGEHEAFAGTLSIGQAALEQLVGELVGSARGWRGVLLVNGHGGNAEPVARAVASLETHHRLLSWWPMWGTDGDLHAGRTETSLLLHLAPSLVRLERAEAGDRRSWPELSEALRTHGVAAVSPNGVLGDPAGASADEGRRLLAEAAADLAAAVERWAPSR